MRARERALSSGWEQAIQRNQMISEPRKKFLVSRKPYWDAWGRGSQSVIDSRDRE